MTNIYNSPVICVFGNGHMFSGVRGKPHKYDYYLSYRGHDYVLGDVAGPAKVPFGKLPDTSKVIINNHNYKIIVLE